MAALAFMQADAQPNFDAHSYDDTRRSSTICQSASGVTTGARARLTSSSRTSGRAPQSRCSRRCARTR
eukprot:5334238-Pyramimonas_sp.AAC.1